MTTDKHSSQSSADAVNLSELAPFAYIGSEEGNEADDITDRPSDNDVDLLSKKEKKRARKERKLKEPEPISAPNQMMIGFYSNVKKKDVERFVRSRAESKMALKSAWYNIIKYDDGFAWELHDGGSGKGALNSIAERLEHEPQVIIALSSETIKITRRSNHTGLVSFRIPDSEDNEISDGIVYADNMKPVVKKGLGLFVTGLVFAFLGVFSIFLASTFKFVILNENEPYQHAKQNTQLPISQIDRLEQILTLQSEGIFIQSLLYKNDSWQVNTGSEEPQTPKQQPTSEPDNQGTENASDDNLVSLARSIDNSNKNNVDRLPPEVERQIQGGSQSTTSRNGQER